jgi:hypothetical protein
MAERPMSTALKLPVYNSEFLKNLLIELSRTDLQQTTVNGRHPADTAGCGQPKVFWSGFAGTFFRKFPAIQIKSFAR